MGKPFVDIAIVGRTISINCWSRWPKFDQSKNFPGDCPGEMYAAGIGRDITQKVLIVIGKYRYVIWRL